MKRLITILLLFISFCSFSQRFVPVNGYGYKYNGLKVDSIMQLPNDTIRNKLVGSIVVKNGVFYIKDATKWKSFATIDDIITPQDYTFHWDVNKYLPFTAKKASDPGFPYFYTSSEYPSLSNNNLKLDGTLHAASLVASGNANTYSRLYNTGDITLSDAGNVFKISTDAMYTKLWSGNLTPKPVIIGDDEELGDRHIENVSIDVVNKLLNLNFTNIKLEKGQANKMLATDNNKNVVYADIPVIPDISGKEDKSNKVTSFSSPTDTQYPSAKLVSDQLATKQAAGNYSTDIHTNIAALNAVAGTNTGDQDLSGLVPKTTTVNGHALSSNVTVTKSDVGLGSVDNTSDADKPISSATQTALNGKINSSLIGANNGIAPLDAGGKVSFTYLPASLMIYKGMWNPTTNTPTLSDGTGTNGWVYKASTNGTVNLGSGSISFLTGDFVIHNGTNWERSVGTDNVVSVNGQQGVVSLSTDNINEGSTNKYYTDARARGALSAGTGIGYDSSSGQITNSAPDQTVTLTPSTGINVTGTYPNFTITNTSPSSGGTVTSVSGTNPIISSGGNTPAISIQSDTLASWRIKQSKGEIAYNRGTYPTSLPTPNAVTFNNSGSGDASGTTFNGSSAKTISYNTIGAQPAGSYATSSDLSTHAGLTTTAHGLGASAFHADNYFELAFSKNTAFNKNFGTTTGTVLEGRTFGTASDYNANVSNVSNTIPLRDNSGNITSSGFYVASNGWVWHEGNFDPSTKAPASGSANYIQNRNSSAQSANMWIDGVGKFGSLNSGDINFNGNLISSSGIDLRTTGTTEIGFGFNGGSGRLAYYGGGTSAVFSVSNTGTISTASHGTSANWKAGYDYSQIGHLSINNNIIDVTPSGMPNSWYAGNVNGITGYPVAYGNVLGFTNPNNGYSYSFQLFKGYNNGLFYREASDVNVNTWNNWHQIYHSGNLTNTLTSGYLPKWNGSAFENSPISISGNNASFGGSVTATGNGTFGGQTHIEAAHIIGYYNYDGDATNYINYYGYNGGTTRARTTIIGDGKSNPIVTFSGSDKSSSFAGSVTATGGGFNSSRKLKNLYPDWKGSALSEINKFKLRDFSYKTDSGKNRTLGFIIDEIPNSVKKYAVREGDAVNTYTLHGLAFKAHQEESERIEKLESMVSYLTTDKITTFKTKKQQRLYKKLVKEMAR